jgi:hypothetical protein
MSMPLAAFRNVEVGVAQILFRLFIADVEGGATELVELLKPAPTRNRFRLAKRIHKMISRDGREWNAVIENFRQIRSGRKQS